MTTLSERMGDNAARPGELVYGWAGEVQALEFRLKLALDVIDGLKVELRTYGVSHTTRESRRELMSEPLSELLVSVLDDYLIDQAETMDREVVIAKVAALEAGLSKTKEALEGGTQKLSDYASYELGNVEAVPSHVEARIVSGLVALEARLSAMEPAAIEAEKMFDVMAIEGIKEWLTIPLRQLYAEVHTDLREALAGKNDLDKLTTQQKPTEEAMEEAQ